MTQTRMNYVIKHRHNIIQNTNFSILFIDIVNITGILDLDKFFHGNIPNGILVDIFGSNGIGKTQLAMQISIHATSEKNQILFQDTTGAFRPERMLEMLQLNNLPEERLNQIFVSRITNVAEQINSLSMIDASKYSLIIIDNISELFSFEYSNEHQLHKKNKLFSKYIKNLSLYAIEHKITIIFTNVVRTIDDKQIENHGKILDMFTHVKIRLDKIDNQRFCTCYTAFNKIKFPFEILSSGLSPLP